MGHPPGIPNPLTHQFIDRVLQKGLLVHGTQRRMRVECELEERRAGTRKPHHEYRAVFDCRPGTFVPGSYIRSITTVLRNDQGRCATRSDQWCDQLKMGELRTV